MVVLRIRCPTTKAMKTLRQLVKVGSSRGQIPAFAESENPMPSCQVSSVNPLVLLLDVKRFLKN